MLTDDELTDAEKQLIQAVVDATTLDLSAGNPDRSNVALAATWDISQTLRAELLIELLTGIRKIDTRPTSTVKLRGARIIGPFDVEATSLIRSLLCHRCYFEESIVLSEARVAAIRLPGCYVPSIDAHQLQTSGNFELNNGFRAQGEVRLLGAHIGGQLNFNGASLTNPKGYAFNGDLLVVDQSMLCRGGFTAEGEVRLPGAHIGGQLNFNGASLTNPKGYALNGEQLTVDQHALFRDGFTARGEVQLSGAQIGGNLNLDKATLTNPNGLALDAQRLLVRNHLLCRDGFAAEGEVRLLGAHIEGQINFSGASLIKPNGYALNGDQLVVDQNMLCRPGFTAEGEIRLLGAHIGGQINFSGASLTNPNGCALDGDQLVVGQNMLCRDGFTAEGEIRLLGAHIGGQLSFDRASLTNPNGYALGANGVVVGQPMLCRDGFTARGEVRLVGANIGIQLDVRGGSFANMNGTALNLARFSSPALYLLPRERPDGLVDLTNARVGSFEDEQNTWPMEMRLRGFTYEILENDSVDVHDRLDWLARHKGGYTPGLYDQLALAYTHTGRLVEARQVNVAKQWRRRRELSWPGKVWNWLLYLTVGYGYRTWLAGAWLAALAFVGSFVFAAAYPAHMHQSATVVPKFNPLVYTLDVLLPIVDLDQQKAWIAQGGAQIWSWVLICAGWLLTTAVVAGLTSALTRTK